VFGGRHDRYVVEGAAVNVTLTWQPLKGVALALDFISVKTAVHDRKIDARDTLAESKFVNDQRVSLGLVASTHFGAKAATDVNITNRRVRHVARL
jgi:hypothetical protein